MFPFSGSRQASWKNHGASLSQSTFEEREEGPFSPAAAGTWLPAPGASCRLPIHAALVCAAGSCPKVPVGRWVGQGEGSEAPVSLSLRSPRSLWLFLASLPTGSGLVEMGGIATGPLSGALRPTRTDMSIGDDSWS